MKIKARYILLVEQIMWTNTRVKPKRPPKPQDQQHQAPAR